MQIKKILETLKRAYNLLKVSSTEPSPKSDIWLKKGKNLFNKNNIVENYYIKDEDGSISEYDSNMCYGLDYIEVSPNAKYTMSNTSSTIFLIAEYDKDKTFIKQNRQNDSNNFLTITTGETTKYIRISLGQTQIETIQFEAGDKTEYEEYIEPKIYVKNNSENYDKFEINMPETITNANGTAIRYPDGTMICYGNGRNQPSQTSTTVTLPANFINTEYIVTTTNIYSYYLSVVHTVGGSNKQKGSFVVFPYDTKTNATPTNYSDFYYTAIGRWK